MMRFIITAAALVAGSIISNAQTMIKGIVKDDQTNLPITGANVFITNTSIATSTDNLGRFILHSKRIFDNITISSVGYETEIVSLSGNAEQIVVALTPAHQSLSPVEIIGIRRPETINTLTESELRRFSGLQLQEALNTVPGINMQSRTPWGGQRIIIRGYYPSADNGRNNSANFNGLGYQLFIDNIPVTDATGLTVMDDIDFFNIGRVEILKGPSPLYGSYIGGAVNLYTVRPAPNQTSLQQQLIAGSYGLFRNNTSFQTSNGHTDVRINYGHQTYNGFRPQEASRKDYISFIANIKAGDRNTLSTYFSFNNSFENLAGEIDSMDLYARKEISNTYYVLNNSHIGIEGFRAGVTDKYEINNHFSNQTTVFATGSTLNQNFAHGFTRNQNISYGGRTAFNYTSGKPVGKIDGTLGASFIKSNQDAHGNFFPPFVQPPFTPSTTPNIPSAALNYALNYCLFTQWKFNLPWQLQLIAGGSMNFIEFGTQDLINNGALYLDKSVSIKVFKPVFSPSGSIIKMIGENSSVFGSVSAGYAPPVSGQMTSSNGAINTGLKPESAFQYEVGLKGSAGKNKSLQYQLSLFDLEIKNRLIQQTSNSVTFYTNASKETNKGLEVYLGYNLIKNNLSFISLLHPWISYTYSDFKYIDFKNHGKTTNGEDSVIADYSGNSVAVIPPHVFNAGIDITTKAGIYLSAIYKYVDKVPVTFDNANYMKAYHLLSGKMGYKVQFGYHLGLDVYAGADNLTNSTFYNFLFSGQNIKELGQAIDPYIQGGGDGYIIPAAYKATFYAGLSLKYNF